MIFVHSINDDGTINVADSKDGIIETYTLQQIKAMCGQSGVDITGIDFKHEIVHPVGLTDVVGSITRQFSYLLRQRVESYTEEQLIDHARMVGCYRDVVRTEGNRAGQNGILLNKLITPSIIDAIKGAEVYSSNIIEVNVSDKKQILSALMNNVCFVIQLNSKLGLTTFCCTANINIMDNLYGFQFIDKVFLTKSAYPLLARPQNIRETEVEYEFKPNNLEVFSCALRFRDKKAKKYEGTGQKELSSPTYTVNVSSVLGMYILNKPNGMGDTVIQEFQRVAQSLKEKPQSLAQLSEKHDFDFGLYNLIERGLQFGVNPLGDKETFMKYMISSDTTKIDLAMKRFQGQWEYMQQLRSQGYSISSKKINY